jgi:hypothetical protein
MREVRFSVSCGEIDAAPGDHFFQREDAPWLCPPFSVGNRGAKPVLYRASLICFELSVSVIG